MRNKSKGYSIRQSGFVLITVLVMLGIATLVSLSIIASSSLQERITGNQQQEINARMQAERGIFATYDYLITNNTATVQLEQLRKGIGGLKQFDADGDGWQIVRSDLNAKELTVVSKGSFSSGDAYLLAKINLITGSNIFENGVVGCDGVALAGGVTIDSYHSKNGKYGGNNVGQNANVSTINAGADIILSGGSDIHGSVTSAGDLKYDGSSFITGNAYAADNFTAGGTSSLGGNLDVGGNATLSESAIVKGNANVTGNVTSSYDNKINGALQYGGTLTSPNGQNPPGSSQLNAKPVLPPLPKRKCDPLDIATKAAPVKELQPAGDISTDYWQNSVGANYSYVINPTKAQVFDSNGYAAAQAQANQSGIPIKNDQKFVSEIAAKPDVNEPIMGFDSSTPVHVFDSLEVKNGGLTISGGHVVIYVKGDVITQGGTPRITIEPGSSLTLLVDGKVKIASDTVVMNNNLGTVDGRPSLSVFSTYSSDADDPKDYGVDISGAGDMYAQVYAPLSNVSMNASGTLSGAVRGKTVVLDGAGKMHYDEALSEKEYDTEDRNQAIAAIHYYYPN